MVALKNIFVFRGRKGLVWAGQYAEGDRFSLIQPSLSDYFINKTTRAGRCGLGMAPQDILFLPFNPVTLSMLDLYLETWLWSR